MINKPAYVVFDFTLDPKNTPKWVDSIEHEETDEWPPDIGTHYRNRNPQGEWTEYELTKYDRPSRFVLSKIGTPYHVRYTFTPKGRATELTYHEWVEEGELEAPFNQAALEKLKTVIGK